MNLSNLLSKLPGGRARPLLILAVALILAVWFVGVFKSTVPARINKLVVFTNESHSFSQSREPGGPLPVNPRPLVTRTNPVPETTRRPQPIFSCHVEVPPEPSTPEPFAPSGRLLQCQLVNTVDSAAIDTPIIGLVVADVWHDGQLVVPAGTEVHGRAAVDRVRERIVSTGAWKLIWHDGAELSVAGVALDREFDPTGEGWGITDGSAGIKGQLLKADSLDQVKLFLATAISGVAAGFQETRDTPWGTRVPGNIRNAAMNATSQVMNQYATQILEAIKRDGFYVRAPAGKQFYVYVQQPVEPGRALKGSAARPVRTTNSTAALAAP